MKSTRIFTFLFILPLLSIAQDCGCDHWLSDLSDEGINIIYAAEFDYEPGDVFCIETDTIAGLRLFDFVGTEESPLIFKNCGGQVIISEDTYSGVSFRQSQYVHLTGSGSDDEFGFHIIETGSSQVGIGISYLSSDFEIDHFEIENTGFAGIMAKTDPKCDDELTWRSNGYVLRNLEIHDNFIHDTEGEGMYIGYTGGYRVTSNVICDGEYVFGHWLENVDIHHNRLENTGWDAIQVNLVRDGGKVHDNTMVNWGTENVTFQDFAMSVGGGTYEIYNNYMLNEISETGKGPQFITMQSGSKIFNNVIINPYSYGMFIHIRQELDDEDLGYHIANNTVVSPEISGIFYNTTITLSEDPDLVGTAQLAAETYFVNNFIASPGIDYEPMGFWKGEPECFFDFINPETRDAQLDNVYSNLKTREIDTVGIVSADENDFRPVDETSFLVDAGSDLTPFGIFFDLNNIDRPQFDHFDIGAYEYHDFSNLNEYHQLLNIYPNPASENIYFQGLSNKLQQTVQLKVYDTSGRLLIQKNAPLLNELDISFLQAGVYVIEFRNQFNEVLYRNVFVKQGM